MKIDLNYKNYNKFALLIWMGILSIIIISPEYLKCAIFPTIILYVFFNIIISFYDKSFILSLPILIIKTTGIVRYLLIPVLMQRNEIIISSDKVSKMNLLMIIEIIGTLIGITVFYYKIWKKQWSQKEIDIEQTSTYFRGVVLFVVVISLWIIIRHPAILTRYFTLSNDLVVAHISGFENLFINVSFLLLYVILLQWIYKKKSTSTAIKVLISIVFSIFFVKGVSFTGGNVSRWTMLVTAYIAFIYIIKFYPSYKNILLIMLIITMGIAVVFGTMLKFGGSYETGYSNIFESLITIFSYKSLNAYFSGPRNMEIGIDLINTTNFSLLKKLMMFVTDVFANFPFLNHYLSIEELQTNNQFNYLIYKSNIARDQIIPSCVQMYIYVGPFFLFLQAFLVYFSLKFYLKMKKGQDLLLIYCYAYLSWWLSLYNCISVSIVLQNLWIHVLPVFLLVMLNRFVGSTILKRRNY